VACVSHANPRVQPRNRPTHHGRAAGPRQQGIYIARAHPYTYTDVANTRPDVAYYVVLAILQASEKTAGRPAQQVVHLYYKHLMDSLKRWVVQGVFST